MPAVGGVSSGSGLDTRGVWTGRDLGVRASEYRGCW